MTEFEKEAFHFIKTGDSDGVMNTIMQHGYLEGANLPCYILNQAFEYCRLELAKALMDKYKFEGLNDAKEPVITFAARYGTRELFEKLMHLGADINALNHVKNSAVGRALAFKNYGAIYDLLDLGFDMKTYAGGKALRNAAWEGETEFVKLFIKCGADVNFNEADQVFPYCTTPVQMAASENHFEIVKYLIEHGANVKIKDKNGERAFSYAKRNKHFELMEYIRQFEPPIWHEVDKKTAELKSLGLPNDIIKWLGTDNKRIDFNNPKRLTDYIEFETIFDVRVIQWQGRVLIDLVKEIENYSNTGFIIWIKDAKCLGSLDVEHEELITLPGLKWKAFLSNASNIINEILDGTLAEKQLRESSN